MLGNSFDPDQDFWPDPDSMNMDPKHGRGGGVTLTMWTYKQPGFDPAGRGLTHAAVGAGWPHTRWDEGRQVIWTKE